MQLINIIVSVSFNNNCGKFTETCSIEGVSNLDTGGKSATVTVCKLEIYTYNLRSNNKFLLAIPPSLNTNKFEDRAFSFAAPTLWNSLPDYVRNALTLLTFKKNLKTHLFEKFYNS